MTDAALMRAIEALRRIHELAQHAPVAQQAEKALAAIQAECKAALADLEEKSHEPPR
jgi:hypothetical protein